MWSKICYFSPTPMKHKEIDHVAIGWLNLHYCYYVIIQYHNSNNGGCFFRKFIHMFYYKKYISAVFFIGFSLSTGLEAFSFSNLWTKTQENPGKTALAVAAVAAGLWAVKSYFFSEKSAQELSHLDTQESILLSSDEDMPSFASIHKDVLQRLGRSLGGSAKALSQDMGAKR